MAVPSGHEYKRKVVLIGDPAVGKTSLINRFVKNAYADEYISTIGAKVAKKEIAIDVGDSPVKVTFAIWDIVGQQGYLGIQSMSFAGAQGALCVCDITRKETLESLSKYWLPLLDKVAQNVPTVFLANKSDLPNAFTREDLKAAASAAKYDGVPLSSPTSRAYLTSAKTGDGVQQAFETLGFLMVANPVLEDDIKRHLDTLLAMDVSQRLRADSPRGVADAIILDVVNGLGDMESAFAIVRAEFVRAGVGLTSPTKEQLATVVKYLADGERVFLGESTVANNLDRRMKLVQSLK